MPCLLPGAIHAVPMDDGGFIQAINKGCFKRLAFAQYKDRVQIRFALVRRCIGQHGRTRSWQRSLYHCCRESELFVYRNKPKQPLLSRNGQMGNLGVGGCGVKQIEKAEVSSNGEHDGFG